MFQTVGVVGAGTIGQSWLQIFGRNQLAAVVYDLDHDRARKVAAAMRSEGYDVEAIDDLARFASRAEYVQECVAEDIEVKRQVLAALDEVAPPHVIIGSSTSAFPVSQFSPGLPGASRCLVVHPTNPPHLLSLVEVVPGPLTSESITGEVMTFMSDLGQSPIHCAKEVPGFVLNRLQYALEREAFYLVRNGVASVGDIDKSVRQGLGPRWAFLGPFGVEATNAATIEEDLQKFGDLMRTLFNDVCQPFDGPNDEDILAVTDGVNEMFAGVAQEDLLAYRDSMLSELAELKNRTRSPYTD